MSIKVMSYVWDHSPHKGSELLMLLSIADHANDDGHAWPSLPRLAKRCRISKRQAITIIQKLEKAGSISIEHGRGRGHVSTYTVKGAPDFTFCPLKGEGEFTIPAEKGEGEFTIPGEEKVNLAAPFKAEKVKSSVIKGEAHFTRTIREPINLKSKTKTPLPPTGGRRDRRCPAGYIPGDGVRTWAQTKYPQIDFDDALEAMRDWEFKQPRSDWDATLRNWIRTEAKRQPLPPAGARRLSRDEAQAIANAKSNQQLEDLVNGHDTYGSVWTPPRHAGAGVPPPFRGGRQSCVLIGP